MGTITFFKTGYNKLVQYCIGLSVRIFDLETKLASETARFKEEEAKHIAQVAELTAEIARLTIKSKFSKNGKDSTTSSTPPSQDIGRSNSVSLREKSDLPSGGQIGHEGRTLQMKEKPDSIEEHKPKSCSGCGASLPENRCVLEQRKQEIVLPPIVAQYVEHQSFSCSCPNCGVQNHATLPARLTGNIQYHPSIVALVATLSVQHYLSYNRISQFLGNMFNIPISEGTVDNMLNEFARQALPVYEKIKEVVGSAGVVGGDETGIKIINEKQKRGWLFTFQCEKASYLVASLSRGFDTIQCLFVDGFPKSVYVSDCLAAQLKTNAQAHQLCLAHLLREVKNFIKAVDCSWSKDMEVLLKDVFQLKRIFRFQDYINRDELERVKSIETRLDQLLETDLEGKHPKTVAFIKRLLKHRDSILTCLYNFHVPADNNASEGSIRVAKVKLKVSGMFRSLAGAERFAVIRSVIDTAIKNGKNPFQACVAIANYQAPPS